MAIQLTITENADPNSQYIRSFLQDRIIIGRARSTDVCLPDMAVSTRHTEIRLKGNDYAVVDLDSRNGTEVNGKAIVAHRPRILKNGDAISIAGFRVYFKLGAVVGKGEPRDVSAVHAREMLARTGEKAALETLMVVDGPSKASCFRLPPCPSSLVIGRDSDAEICLDDRDVSRSHAQIVVEPEGVFVRDLDSRNGLFVEAEKVDAARLAHGMCFRVGRTTLVLEHPLERSLVAIYEAPEEKTASFALIPPDIGAETESVSVLDEPEEKDPTSKTRQSSSEIKLPLGPADPLIQTEEQEQLTRRTTSQIPYPEQEVETRSDMGLIIIGAIIVIAAVAGLVYIFV